MHSYQQDRFQGSFNDSVIIHPIHMKSNINVVPSFLHRGNQENTILATYDKFKLTQFSQNDHQVKGDIVNILSIDPDSLIINITKEGAQFFQKFSSNDITFITIVGEKQAGKSFFLDKIINLTNFSGNHFCQSINNKPGLNVWTVPFIKQELKIFLIDGSSCSTNSRQFKALAPYITILSSAVINLSHYKNQQIAKQSKNNDSLNFFQTVISQTIQSIKTDQENQKSQILPEIYYNIKRTNSKKNEQKLLNLQKNFRIHIQQELLPDALVTGYPGNIQDLKSHSFLNKNCISQEYVTKVSHIFQKIYNKINQKKYRELIFNGNIVLKLLKYVDAFLKKNRKIQLDLIYGEIVNDLYISAYNYCVISYHQDLQKALQNEQPHSLENLIEIFQHASKEVIEKYNQFTLDPQCHRLYQQKLFSHIESKQKLILQINRKKTEVQIQKIIEKTDMSNIQTAWQNVKAINQSKKYHYLNHGKSNIIGQTLKKIILNTKNANNIDYRILKQIQKLKTQKKQKQTQLLEVKEKNKQVNEKQFKINQQRKNLEKSLKDIQQNIRIANRDIKIYSSNQEHNMQELTDEKNKLTSKFERNQKILEQLRENQNPQIQKIQKEKTRQIQGVISKQRLLQTTLQDLQKQKGGMSAVNGQQKEKQKQQKNVPQRQSKTKKQSVAKKQQSSTSKINQSKKSKKNQ